jgi:predicted PhzF superfamily epimerase YddE/YHI9
MFAPLYVIKEESATGMAAGPLGCFLYDKESMHREQFLIEQGHLMSPPSPSLIHVKLSFNNGRIMKVMAGGKAKVVSSMTIDV